MLKHNFSLQEDFTHRLSTHSSLFKKAQNVSGQVERIVNQNLFGTTSACSALYNLYLGISELAAII